MPPGDGPINLNAFSCPHFRAAVSHHVEVYRAYFGERLLAVYVWGSVHRNEAVWGVSDLDLHAFIADAGREAADAAWYESARGEMDAQFPHLAALSRPLPASLLDEGARPDASPQARAAGRAFGFRLRYDATRVWGRELVSGAIVPLPDKEFARAAFPAARDLARFAAGRDDQNKTDFDLPNLPLPRLRKLARLAVLGGGYLLMAKGEFRSFKGSDVLPSLLNALPDWKPFLEQTAGLYVLPPAAAPEHIVEYLARLTPWMDWVDQRLNGD